MGKLLRNSTVLTCIGGVGVVATAVTASKATPKALAYLERAKEEKGADLTPLEKFKIAGPVYIPSVLIGAATLACIFGANALNKKQQASLMSAYALLDNSYKEYKAKVKDIYGEEGVQTIREKIAKNKYEEEKTAADDGRLLFYDEFSGRFFRSTMEKVRWAEYEVNRDLVMRGWACINDFYEYLNVPLLDSGYDLGWTPAMNSQDYWQEWVDFSNAKSVMDDGTEYYIITMFQEPRLNFADFE